MNGDHKSRLDQLPSDHHLSDPSDKCSYDEQSKWVHFDYWPHIGSRSACIPGRRSSQIPHFYSSKTGRSNPTLSIHLYQRRSGCHSQLYNHSCSCKHHLQYLAYTCTRNPMQNRALTLKKMKAGISVLHYHKLWTLNKLIGNYSMPILHLPSHYSPFDCCKRETCQCTLASHLNFPLDSKIFLQGIWLWY